MEKVNWGIIGCGDVTELKSGPAFNKVGNSALIAVMRRDEEKVKDYAKRHGVPKWYTDARQLINDPDINAVYVATPPSTHEEYTVAALAAGKPVYVEKPMSTDASSSERMMNAALKNNTKLSVAHYRRAQPFFKKIKELIDEKIVGDTRFARIDLYKKPLTQEELAVPRNAWRVDTGIAGGGLFHDLAPHQLDLMYYFFGPAAEAKGISTNQSALYRADDLVTGSILFRSGVVFSGTWSFNAGLARDTCEIVGTKGTIDFSVFENNGINIALNGDTEKLSIETPHHVQQPMIQQVVDYFSGTGPNPCSAEDGVAVMKLIDGFTGN